MQAKTRGIVLHYLKYGDSGLVVTTYTEAFGRISFLLKGARGKKTKVKSNLIQPLFLLEMEVSFKPGRELQRITEIKNAKPFLSIPFVITKSTQALFLGEFLYKILYEEEANPPTFDFLFNTIQILDVLEEGVSNFHLMFLLKLSRFLGFEPSVPETGQQLFFDLQNGIFVNHAPSHPYFISPEKSMLFAQLLTVDFKSLPSLKLNHKIRDSLLESILDYYSLHFNRKVNIKSLDVLRELFN